MIARDILLIIDSVNRAYWLARFAIYTLVRINVKRISSSIRLPKPLSLMPRSRGGWGSLCVSTAVCVRRTLASPGPQRVMLCRDRHRCPMTDGGLLWNGGQFQ